MNLQVKSTLDRLIHDLASSLGLVYIDLDGTAFSSEQLLQANNAIAWSSDSYQDELYTPFFTLHITVGCVTRDDPAQYTSMSVIDSIMALMGTGKSVAVYDYTALTDPTEQLGSLYVTGAVVQPVAVDVMEGFRTVSITCRGVRFT